MLERSSIEVIGAREHNLKNLDISLDRGSITVITGVSGSGKSSLAFDTILAEAQRRFFYTLSHYTRQFLDLGNRPAVASLTGLSPAIALAQNETQASVRASVGTLTDVSELLGVLFSRFATKNCPVHGLETTPLSLSELSEQIQERFEGKKVAIFAPFVEKKKGSFKKPLNDFLEKGYLRALIDGELVGLDPIPELNKEKKHDISILVDVLRVDSQRASRLESSLKTSLELGSGMCEVISLSSAQNVDLRTKKRYSQSDGCSSCGYTWPKLDSRHFSANSLGSCKTCKGLGFLKWDDEDTSDVWSLLQRQCPSCEGIGLKEELSAIDFHGLNPIEAHKLEISILVDRFTSLDLSKENPACQRVVVELIDQLQRMLQLGLGYLALSRRIRSLSGGEAQRLRLSGVIGENLRGVLYVLDEPSQGLSGKEIDQLWENLDRLKRAGNTIIIVDHDEQIIRRADQIIDLGPTGGTKGGFLQAKFSPKDAAAFAEQSLTAKYLSVKAGKVSKVSQFKPEKFLVIDQPKLFNLDFSKAKFPLGGLSVVHGVSGAGKTSLVFGILARNLERYLAHTKSKNSKKSFDFTNCRSIEGIEEIEHLVIVDRKSIAKSSVSMPATYLGIFKEIRTLFSKLPEAQIAGLTDRAFSLSVEGGRCPECKGRGQLSLSMKFLADAKVICPICEGYRYRPQVLDVRYRGYSIADVLNLTIEEALDLFSSHRLIKRKLDTANDLGLGYLSLGQPSSQLSGGEAQRLKLSMLLSKKIQKASLVIMDEPTRGLHFVDVERLMQQLFKLREEGASVVLIEHNEDVIDASDWRIELGPGAASAGGKLVYSGHN